MRGRVRDEEGKEDYGYFYRRHDRHGSDPENGRCHSPA